ncbi:MAG: hypothetical protein AABY04_04040, partial [Candidatus Micrarchaeota archaeon]
MDLKLVLFLLLFGIVLANAEFTELGAFAKVAPNDKINVNVLNDDNSQEIWGAVTKNGIMEKSEKKLISDYSVSVKANRKAIKTIYSAQDPIAAYHQARSKGLVKIEFRAWDRKFFAFFGDFFIGIYYYFSPPKKIYDFGIDLPPKIITSTNTPIIPSPKASLTPTAIPSIFASPKITAIPSVPIATPIIQELEEFQYSGEKINFDLLDFPFNEFGCKYGDNEFGLMGTLANSSYPINRSLAPVDQGKWGNFSCGPCSGGAGLDYFDRNGYSNISNGLDDLIKRLHTLMGTDGTSGISVGDFVGGFVFRMNETGYAANFTIKFWLDQPDKPPIRRFKING